MKNVEFIKRDVPIELIEYVSDIFFDIGITHSSTSIGFISCVKEKIVLYDLNNMRYYDDEQ